MFLFKVHNIVQKYQIKINSILSAMTFTFYQESIQEVKVKVQVLSLDPKLALTTSQFYLAGHWKWPHSYILSFTGSKFNAPQGLNFPLRRRCIGLEMKMSENTFIIILVFIRSYLSALYNFACNGQL